VKKKQKKKKKSLNTELGGFSAFKRGMSIAVSISNEKTSGPQEQSVK